MNDRLLRIQSGLPDNFLVEYFETSALSVSKSARSLTTKIRGPLVRAGEANLNGALFEVSDLEFGLPSLLEGSPLTLNHRDEAVGFLSDARLESSSELGVHVTVEGFVWTTRLPHVARALESAIQSGQGALSMECVPEAVACGGCDCVVTRENIEEACQHIQLKTASRRMVNPTFWGAALVLPPHKPGWPAAILRTAS